MKQETPNLTARTVLLIMIVTLGGLSLTVGVAAGTSSFDLQTEAPSSAEPGETVSVTYTVENTGDTNLDSLGLQTTDVADGLTVTNIDSENAQNIADEQNAVFFPTVSPGETVTATFTVEIAGDASGSQMLVAEASAGFDEDEVSRTSETTISVETSPEGGQITGQVRDTEDNPISGAEVRLYSRTSSVDYGTKTTGPDGSYTFSSIAPGKYTIEASYEGSVGTAIVTVERGTVVADVVLLDDDDENEPPTADFTYSPSSPEVGDTVSFDGGGFNLSTDPDGSITSYEWEFGDGTTATGETVTHSYSNSVVGSWGDYTVTLTVTDDDGATDKTTKLVSVTGDDDDDLPPPPPETDPNQSPTAEFTYSPSNPDGETVIFFDAVESSDPDGEIQSYEWSFGDGSTSTGEVSTHKYGSAGDYTVTLTVTDDDGATDTVTKTVTVQGDSNSPGVITGHVTDTENNPVRGATIEILRNGNTVNTVTAVNSSYTVSLAPGRYTLRGTKSGFEARPTIARVESERATDANIVLQREDNDEDTGDEDDTDDEAGGSIGDIDTSLQDMDNDGVEDRVQIDVTVSDAIRTEIELGGSDFYIDLSPTDDTQGAIFQQVSNDKVQIDELGETTTTYTVVADLSNQESGDTGTVDVNVGEGADTDSATYTIPSVDGTLSTDNPFADANNEAVGINDAADVLFDWNQDGEVEGVEYPVEEIANYLFEWNQATQ